MTQKTQYDIVIIGAGPAGIQAAIHASRKQTRVLVLGRLANSALFKGHIENYAFVGKVTPGRELLEQGLAQINSFGAEHLAEDLLQLSRDGEQFVLDLESGLEIRTQALVLAMGTAKKKLGVPGEKEFLSQGVSYCVDCDANFFRKATVCVTGDRSAAVDGALTLQKIAAKVYLVTDKLEIAPSLKRLLDASAVEQINGKITLIQGEKGRGLQQVELADGRKLVVDGLFIELGSKGALELATQIGVALDTDTMQYIAVNRQQETNIAGVYAAGDITGPPFQMAKAVGEGCVAGMAAAAYVRDLQRKAAVQKA